jgi:hypothetical protein
MSTRNVSRRRSRSKRMRYPIANRRAPRIAFPPRPACSILERHRTIASRETSQQKQRQRGADAEGSHNDGYLYEILALRGMDQVAPSVGPTQGLHTAPSRSPMPNWLLSPVGAKPSNLSSTYPLTDPAEVNSRVWNCRTSSTTPTPSINRAATLRKTEASKPIENPIVATKRPIVTKDRARPAASAAGPKRC